VSTTPVLGTLGKRVDILLRRGCNWGPFVATMTNPDGTPVDLTGSTFEARIKRKANDAQPVAVITMALLTDGTDGKYTLAMDHTVTDALTTDPDITKPGARYVWDAEEITASGERIPRYYGVVTVQENV
jgi:hypothetical protein